MPLNQAIVMAPRYYVLLAMGINVPDDQPTTQRTH